MVGRTGVVSAKGNFYMSAEYAHGAAPVVSISGRAASIVVDGTEVLPTRWESLAAPVQSAFIGGVFGFLASLLVQILVTLVSNRLHRRGQPRL
jgi:hypothetical protein